MNPIDLKNIKDQTNIYEYFLILLNNIPKD